MKAITVIEPWASLLALTAKEYETRSWQTKYRGPIAIHAGKTRLKYYPRGLDSEIYAMECHFGCVIAIADLVDIIRMTPEFIASVSTRERAMGDWEEGRFAWKLANVRRIEPVPARGMQGLWNWERDEDTIWGPSPLEPVIGLLRERIRESGNEEV